MVDAAYSATRRQGQRAVVVRVGEVVGDPETLEQTQELTTTNVRLVVKEPTPYSRIIRAQATQQDVGKTTFLFWTRDVPFTQLDVEDYIIMDGIKHQVVTSTVERTTLVVTADELRGAIGEQIIEQSASNSMLNDGVV